MFFCLFFFVEVFDKTQYPESYMRVPVPAIKPVISVFAESLEMNVLRAFLKNSYINYV